MFKHAIEYFLLYLSETREWKYSEYKFWRIKVITIGLNHKILTNFTLMS